MITIGTAHNASAQPTPPKSMSTLTQNRMAVVGQWARGSVRLPGQCGNAAILVLISGWLLERAGPANSQSTASQCLAVNGIDLGSRYRHRNPAHPERPAEGRRSTDRVYSLKCLTRAPCL